MEHKKIPLYMTLEIHVLTWDRPKHVAVLNWLMLLLLLPKVTCSWYDNIYRLLGKGLYFQWTILFYYCLSCKLILSVGSNTKYNCNPKQNAIYYREWNLSLACILLGLYFCQYSYIFYNSIELTTNYFCYNIDFLTAVVPILIIIYMC